ncbi:hypothetical protein O181_095038 [Austropuccinia psidii MF-1]|uniref:Uncharacterized protein n=1 Tax=Austropuccinia psidii MF-1 TaxID=1389203 RepID=A0A9Q3J346_9BASI|nr:hypothetical protein [Austropuccinia psidii MF-1]
MELHSQVELTPQKGKKGKIPSGTESTQRSALSQRQVPHIPMISESELEISMRDSNRYKSHSEGSDGHLHEPVQAVLHNVQGKGLGNVLTNTPRSDEILANPQKAPQKGGNSEILQWMESTIIQTSNQKDQGIPRQNEGGNQGRSTSSFYQQAPRREEQQEKELEKIIFPKLQDSKNPKRCHGQCLQHGKNLDGIQGQGGANIETTSFPKEITLSPYVLNPFTENKDSILPLKEIKNSLLSLKEINNNLSSLTKIFLQNEKEIYSIKSIVENNKSKVLIDNTQKLIQEQQELYKYIKHIKDETLTINYDLSIDNLTEKLNNLSISVERFEEKTSSHQKLLLDHVEKSDEARMNLKDEVKSEIILTTEKMDKINEANLNMSKLSTLFSHIRGPVKPIEEITNPFITDLSHQENNQVLIKEAHQLKEWPTFTGEGEYDHMSFIKTIEMLQDDYAIPDELITTRLHSLFEKSAKRWYYGIRKTNGKKYLVLVETRNNHQVS